MRATKTIRKHPQFTPEDYEYLSGKGYKNREILSIWNRELKQGKSPVSLNKSKIDWKAWDKANGFF